MSFPQWPPKDPDEVLDYVVYWRSRLTAADTIVSSQWTVDPAGLSIDSSSFGADTTTVWLSGGTVDTRYNLTNRITTALGRTMDQSVSLRVRPK